MHNGSVAEFPKIRYHIEKLITPEYYALREGATDTEALFLVALSLGLENNPQDALEKTLSAVQEIMRKHQITGPLRASIATTNGTDVYVLRYSNTESCPSLYYATNIDLKHLDQKNQTNSNILIVSEPLDETLRDHYHEISNGTLLHINTSGSVQSHQLSI